MDYFPDTHLLHWNILIKLALGSFILKKKKKKNPGDFNIL